MKGNISVFSNLKRNPNDYSKKEMNGGIEYHPLKNSIKKEISVKGKKLLEEAKTQEVKDLVKQLYRPGAKIGDGGTADALKHEKKTGENIGNKGHEQKAKERVAQINKLLSKYPNHQDKELLLKLKKDLENALNGGK